MTYERLYAADSPGFLIWQVHNLWQKKIRAMLKPLGITHVQYILLAGMVTLRLEEKMITQTRLAKLTNTDPMMTSVVLRKLEERGYLSREPHPDDPRAIQIDLTNKGIILVQRALALVEDFETSFFCDFERQDQRHLEQDLRLLLKMA